MENVLYIKIGDLNVEFMLVTRNSAMEQNHTFTNTLYEYVGKGIGYKTIEAELAHELIAYQDNKDEIERILTMYYESLLVGRDCNLAWIEDRSLINQFELLLAQAQKKVQHNEKGVLENTGVMEKFEGLLKRVRFDTVKYPIDQVILVDQQLTFTWMSELIRNVYKDIPFEVGKAGHPISSNSKKKAVVAKQLTLRYLNVNDLIMDVCTDLQEVQKGSISFKIKFALDTHVHMSIFESWRERGIKRERNVTNYSFNLPFFYTDDIIHLTATFHPDRGYSFEVVHVDTGERDTF